MLREERDEGREEAREVERDKERDMMRRIVSTLLTTSVAAALLVLVITGTGATASTHRGGDEVGADVAALHDLQAGFHAAISGGGHIDDLMALWADDSTFTAGGTTLHGKDEIRAFFLTTGGFTHNWVSLSPSFKTRIEVHGDWAHLYFECHFVDWQANPQVVVTHGTFDGTAKEVHGHWLFWNVTAGTNPLTP